MAYRLWLTSMNTMQTNFHFHSPSAVVLTEIKTAWLIFMTKAQKSCVLLSAPITTTIGKQCKFRFDLFFKCSVLRHFPFYVRGFLVFVFFWVF